MIIGKLVWVRNASFIRLQVAVSDIEKARYYKQEAVNKHFFFCFPVTRIQILALCRHIHKF